MSRISSGSFLIITLVFYGLFNTAPLYADNNVPKVVQVQLGDYRFMPDEIQLVAGQPVVLQLVNTDILTPHNFTLDDPDSGLDVNVDVPAGDAVEVNLMPLWPGRHTFYCSKKLLFMKNHREKGMEGTLVVVPERR